MNKPKNTQLSTERERHCMWYEHRFWAVTLCYKSLARQW